ncbi:MAG: hypothetical protein LUG86_01360 [Oscillospiraceae bacterium]|nr:hypothetical protein [Oscillospiraceae bacterium]
MKQVQEILAEAASFRARRSNLAQNLRNVDEKKRKAEDKLNSEHAARIRSYESEKDSALNAIDSRTTKQLSGYAQMKSSYQKYADPVRHWCPQSRLSGYNPQPSLANEAELSRLMNIALDEGFVAWIKRTFRLGGYMSREEAAYNICRSVEDGCAYLNQEISGIQSKANEEKSAKITEARRKTAEENERYMKAREDLDRRFEGEKKQASETLSRFDSSSELKSLREKVERMKAEGDNSCGKWGEYSAPTEMPEKVMLLNAGVSLPNEYGAEEKKELPAWISLYESNIIVLTSSTSSAASTDSKANQFVRKFLARMLKTVPPENLSYSVFDSLHQGTSLERLIDVINIGTTDINFELFTSNENTEKQVSCAERRKYLCSRPAEIIQFTAGKSKSLFDYVRECGNFEFPFTWYIDFNFPDTPDNKLVEDMKKLFVNAPAAGYSFMLVTSPSGYGAIKELAEKYTQIPLIHVDLDRNICEKGNMRLDIHDYGNPSEDQIYNFMTALKKYYEDGDTVNNKLFDVFNSKGIDQRDASKKLSIPMALDSRGNLVDLELGGTGSVHGFISGGTNSGKSTLLHTIILSACLHYSPDDLEIWLVDYKQTEFFLYKKFTPPHIKLIGVSKTPDFTFSLLDKIYEEANRRTELLNRFESQNLAEYRRHKGEPGYVNLPRLFIVIDEFHEMSQFVSTEMKYKDMLENILREYRAQGITCLLADQVFSTGLSGLSLASKAQIGLRIAMRNEASPQELKNTLEADRGMYSDSMEQTIALMKQGDFIMKVPVRNRQGDVTGIRLEKFRGLLSKSDDISLVGRALMSKYKGQYSGNLLYVNTKEQVSWDDSEPMALDKLEPLRYQHMRLYLGRSATLRPCFGVDLGRQPDENLSIVGGTAYQRWELLTSVMRSCKYRGYKLLVFMYEFSDIATDSGDEVRRLCQEIPGAELMVSIEEWCSKLSEIDKNIKDKKIMEDTICIFVGLEIAVTEFSRLPDQNGSGGGSNLFRESFFRYGTPVPGSEQTAPQASTDPTEFDATPIIDNLFSVGARNGIRCVVEASGYRNFSKTLKIKNMCRHKIAFSMSADDCMNYLGNSNFQKNIGENAVYNDGSKEVKKLLPYKLNG